MEATAQVTDVSSNVDQNASDDVDIYCEPCSTDSKRTYAKGFCVQCEEYVCDACIKDHRKFSMSRSHAVLDQSQMPTNYQKKKQRVVECIEPCSKHQNETNKFFCKPHRILGCSVCIMLEHRTCEVEYIPQASTDFRNNTEYLETKKELNNLIRNVEAMVQKARTHLDYVNGMCTLEIEETKAFRMEINTFLENKEKELLATIQELKRANVNIIDTVKTEAENIGARLLSMNASLKADDANDVQLYMAAKTIKSQLGDLHNMVGRVGNETRFSEFCFKKDTALSDLFLSATAFGTIETNDLTIWHQDHRNECLLTVSVNLGATYTGLFFMLPKISTGGMLSLDKRGLVVEHAPTSVLLRPDGQTFEAFGFDAEDKYLEFDDSAKSKWYFFRRFWLQLNQNMQKMSVETLIKDETRKELRAPTVISAVLKFLLQNFLHFQSMKRTCVTSTDIHLILTVPGTLNNDALMKLAVRMTGIKLGDLSIVSEPEAASIFCLYRDGEGLFQGHLSKPGTRHILCDLKDERLDLTLHEVENKRQVKHIVTEHDMSLGVSTVNEAFEKLINSLAGCDVMTCLRNEHYEEYVALMEEFGDSLGEYRNSASSKQSFRISDTLAIVVKELTSRSFEEQIQLSVHSDKVKLLSCYKMRIDRSVYNSLFDTLIKDVAARIRTFIAKHDERITLILIVGQFFVPEALQVGVKAALSDLKVFIPKEHTRAVLQGAAMWGQESF